MDDADPRLMRPFLSSEAAVLGVGQRSLRSGDYRPLLRGVLVDRRIPDTVVTRSRGVLLVVPDGAVLSHWTAARLWGGRVPDNDSVHVSYSAKVSCRVKGVRPHCFRYALDRGRRHGMQVTTPLMTFCHMARFLGLLDLVALGDSLVGKGRFSPGELRSYADAWPHQFAAEARLAASFVRDRVDSSPESALRVLMVLSGLPEPDVDIHVVDADGQVRFRIDLGYKEVRLAIEYDGRWHESAAQTEADHSRRGGLAAEENWTFVVVTGDELYSDTENLVARLHEAARRAGLAVPVRPSEGWRRYFRVVHVAA